MRPRVDDRSGNRRSRGTRGVGKRRRGGAGEMGDTLRTVRALASSVDCTAARLRSLRRRKTIRGLAVRWSLARVAARKRVHAEARPGSVPCHEVERCARRRCCPAVERPRDCSSLRDSRLRGRRRRRLSNACNAAGDFGSGRHGSYSRERPNACGDLQRSVRQTMPSGVSVWFTRIRPRHGGDEPCKSCSAWRLCAGWLADASAGSQRHPGRAVGGVAHSIGLRMLVGGRSCTSRSSRESHTSPCLLARTSPRGVNGVTLERLDVKALEAAVLPDVGRSRLGRQHNSGSKTRERLAWPFRGSRAG